MEKLKERWNTTVGREVYSTIIKNINKGGEGWDIIEKALEKLPHNDELPLLKQEKNNKSRNFRESDFRGIDLSNKNLSNSEPYFINAYGANLNSCKIDNSNFYVGTIEKASLMGIKGKNLWFSGTHIKNSNLDNTKFTETEFSCILQEVSFKNSLFRDCKLSLGFSSQNIDFTGSIFDNTRLSIYRGLEYENKEYLNEPSNCWLNLKKVIFTKGSRLTLTGKWEKIYFDEADLSGLDFSGYAIQGNNPLQNASFQRSNLKNINFSNLNLNDANMEQANLEGSNFENSILKNVNFRGANLQNANFRGANLQGADFTSANTKGVDFMGTEF